MQLVPYLNFNGRCREAFECYARVLGGEIAAMLTFGETPAADHVPPELHAGIIHARLVAGDAVLMGSDCPPDRYETPAGISVCLQIADPAVAERVFNALAEGGNVVMPFGETFWALRFGMVTDRFGTPWMINCERAG
jgi:PhnB protein